MVFRTLPSDLASYSRPAKLLLKMVATDVPVTTAPDRSATPVWAWTMPPSRLTAVAVDVAVTPAPWLNRSPPPPRKLAPVNPGVLTLAPTWTTPPPAPATVTLLAAPLTVRLATDPAPLAVSVVAVGTALTALTFSVPPF